MDRSRSESTCSYLLAQLGDTHEDIMADGEQGIYDAPWIEVEVSLHVLTFSPSWVTQDIMADGEQGIYMTPHG